MSEQNKFSYEAENPKILFMQDKTEDAKIMDVTFLTTARVKYVVKGEPYEELLDIDLINQEAFFKNGKKAAISEKIFQHLNSINELPDEFFSPPEESNKVTRQVMSEHGKMLEEKLGVFQEEKEEEQEDG